MPRKPRTHAHQARAALLRGNIGKHYSSPHAALQTAIPEEEWQALLEGRAARFYMQNGLKARKAVQKRHPMRAGEGR